MFMKTTMTILNPIDEAAKQLAQRLDVSMCDLYTVALTAYVTAHKREEVTEALNRVYETKSSTIEPEMVHLQLASTGGASW